MQKLRNCLVIFALATAVVLSCGIPTSMPTLPKEVVVKGSPTVSVPLGKVNYNLYSGINGEGMSGKLGSLDDLLDADWLQDLQDDGATIYDYRPAGLADDGVQKFLIHYKLDMEDTLGSAGSFDLNEYRAMIDQLAEGEPKSIANAVSFTIPEVAMEKTLDVDIPLGGPNGIAGAIEDSIKFQPITALLPDIKLECEFPDDDKIKNFQGTTGGDLSVTLSGLDSLTLASGKLLFTCTFLSGSLLQPGSTLELSNFGLRFDGKSESVVSGSGAAMKLDYIGASGTTEISFDKSVTFTKIELVCTLIINGSSPGPGPGYFTLQIAPVFEAYTISGVEGLVLSKPQLDSLQYKFSETDPANDYEIGGNLGPSFKAEVGTGELEIDATKLFPSLDDPARPELEYWNLKMDLSKVAIQQDTPSGYGPGLSLGGPGDPLRSGSKPLEGKTLNNQKVKIRGSVAVGMLKEEDKLPDGGGKLSFRNFPNGGIKIQTGVPTSSAYAKELKVNMNVDLFSVVTALPGDIGLNVDAINQNIDLPLGNDDDDDDFTAFKDWFNYIQFGDGGLGIELYIEKLSNAGGLGLYVDVPQFELDPPFPFQELKNLKDPTGKDRTDARLIFTNTGELRLKGEKLPDESLSITVKLGMKDPEDQKKYEDPKSGILTLRNIDPKVPIKLEGMEARMVFNWTEISVKPIPEDPEDPWPDDDPRPDYPFIGTYPDKDKGEEGIDLSGIPKGLGFYVPEEGDENGESVSAYLYITLTRQVFENDAWVDDPDRPGGEGQAPYGWGDNLKVNLPSLDFHARYGDNKDDVSENLFAYNPNEERGISDWALSRPIDLEDPECVDQAFITADENPDNPFKIYSGPTLPEMDKAIPIGNMAKVFNENLIGEKDLYFDYTVKLSSIPDEGSESLKEASGEIILYPDMLKKRVQASVDMLIVVPLIFKALQTDPDPAVPVVVTIAPDLGDDDLFGRKSSDDNEYFDMVKSLGFDINIKNLAGLSAGRFFLENQTGEESSRYRTSAPIIDFSKPQNKFSLGGEELETIKAIWPFVPQLSIEFEPGEEVRIERNFNIELQSITIKAGGEYTFETGW